MINQTSLAAFVMNNYGPIVAECPYIETSLWQVPPIRGDSGQRPVDQLAGKIFPTEPAEGQTAEQWPVKYSYGADSAAVDGGPFAAVTDDVDLGASVAHAGWMRQRVVKLSWDVLEAAQRGGDLALQREIDSQVMGAAKSLVGGAVGLWLGVGADSLGAAAAAVGIYAGINQGVRVNWAGNFTNLSGVLTRIAMDNLVTAALARGSRLQDLYWICAPNQGENYDTLQGTAGSNPIFVVAGGQSDVGPRKAGRTHGSIPIFDVAGMITTVWFLCERGNIVGRWVKPPTLTQLPITDRAVSFQLEMSVVPVVYNRRRHGMLWAVTA